MRNTRSDAGFTLIDLLFTMALIGTLSTIAMPGLMRARSQAGAASAVGSLRLINSGQLSYAITCGSGFYAPSLLALGAPPIGSTYGFLPPDLGSAVSAQKAGYLIQMSGRPFPPAPGSCNGIGAGAGTVGYRAGANSLNSDFPVHFSTNTSGAIWTGVVPLYATTGEAVGPPAGSIID